MNILKKIWNKIWKKMKRRRDSQRSDEENENKQQLQQQNEQQRQQQQAASEQTVEEWLAEATSRVAADTEAEARQEQLARQRRGAVAEVDAERPNIGSVGERQRWDVNRGHLYRQGRIIDGQLIYPEGVAEELQRTGTAGYSTVTAGPYAAQNPDEPSYSRAPEDSPQGPAEKATKQPVSEETAALNDAYVCCKDARVHWFLSDGGEDQVANAEVEQRRTQKWEQMTEAEREELLRGGTALSRKWL